MNFHTHTHTHTLLSLSTFVLKVWKTLWSYERNQNIELQSRLLQVICKNLIDIPE